MEQVAIPSLAEVLRTYAEQNGQAPAILVPGRKPLSYARLYAHVTETVRVLNEMGIGRNHRLAIVVPSGAEAGVVSVAAQTATAYITFNPAQTLPEFTTLLMRLKIRTIIIMEGLETAAWLAADQLGLHIITLKPQVDGEAGLFQLHSARTDIAPISPESGLGGFAHPDDISKFLLTSGTTAASKIIPYTQQACDLQLHINGEALQLTSQDRLLSILPLFHGAGIGYLMQSLWFGGSTVILPGFEVNSFFQSLKEFQPTWFTAVTTLYQTILDQVPQYPDVMEHLSLRFIIAVSMAIDSERSTAVERVLKSPIIQVYGTTEAGLISSNPLPPRTRKLGSAGLPVGNEVAMIDDNNQFLPHGETGEIVVRGPSVMAGYEDDPEATAQAFYNGWYRTGDLGYFDSDGYMFIIGRVKEVINRGGQKVSPGEVEQALLTHPQVAQAAVFALPDASMGEEVGAAVVLRTPDAVTEAALRAFAALSLSTYKVPRRIAFVAELPRNAIGKVQRIGLAQKLGLTLPAPVSVPAAFIAPRTDTERCLAQLWAEVLRCDSKRIGVHTRFADLGGVSLSAAHLIFKTRGAFDVPVTIVDLFDAPTIAEQALVIDKLKQDPASHTQGKYLIPIQLGGAYPPVYCLHALKGGVYFYQELVPFLSPEQPIYGLIARGMDDGLEPFHTVEEMAAHHFQQIMAVQLRGPYYLCGYSFGGRVALETARKLSDAGHTDTYVLIIDDQFQTSAPYRPPHRQSHTLLQRLGSLRFALTKLQPLHRRLYLQQRVSHYWKKFVGHRPHKSPPTSDPILPPTVQRVVDAAFEAGDAYMPRPYAGHIRYLYGLDNEINIPLFKTLQQIGVGDFSIRNVPGTHDTLFTPSYVEAVGQEVNRWLAEQRGQPTG